MPSRSSSAAPARPLPKRTLSTPSRSRSPPTPVPLLRSLSYSPPPSPTLEPVPIASPPLLNLVPATPVSTSSSDSRQLPKDNSSPLSSDSTKLTTSTSLDAIHEVIESLSGSDSESARKESSQSSSLIVRPPSPQRKSLAIERQRSMTVEVTGTQQVQLSSSDKSIVSKTDVTLKKVKSADTMKPAAQTKLPKKKRSRTVNPNNSEWLR
jgi:hypothetical protein